MQHRIATFRNLGFLLCLAGNACLAAGLIAATLPDWIGSGPQGVSAFEPIDSFMAPRFAVDSSSVDDGGNVGVWYSRGSIGYDFHCAGMVNVFDEAHSCGRTGDVAPKTGHAGDGLHRRKPQRNAASWTPFTRDA